MSSQTALSAEEKFRQAFDRLKAGKSVHIALGSPVTQNNVAREAGLDPSALKKARFPTLIAAIQLYIQEHGELAGDSGRKQRARLRVDKKELSEQVKALEAQRDVAQSQLLSAQRAVLELLQEIADLRTRIAELSGEVLTFGPPK